MSAIRRFMALEDENSVFKFTIDTTKIVSGATNGSENPLTFKIPLHTSENGVGQISCIVKVSDGRADVTINNQTETNSRSLLTFSNPGIYDITIIGKIGRFSFNDTVGYDKKKIIEITSVGRYTGFRTACFYGCENLIYNAPNVLTLPANSVNFFRGIKGFGVNSSLDKIDTSKITGANAQQILSDVQQPLTTMLNPFWNQLTTYNGLFTGSNLDAVPKIEVISETITAISQPFNNSNYRGRIEFKTPNLTSIYRVIYGYTNPPALGGIDIRNLTSCDALCTAMSKENIDATLIEWATGYDWSAIPTIANKVNINFNGNAGSCTASNISPVIAAKAFLESKGIVFPHLTLT